MQAEAQFMRGGQGGSRVPHGLQLGPVGCPNTGNGGEVNVAGDMRQMCSCAHGQRGSDAALKNIAWPQLIGSRWNWPKCSSTCLFLGTLVELDSLRFLKQGPEDLLLSGGLWSEELIHWGLRKSFEAICKLTGSSLEKRKNGRSTERTGGGKSRSFQTEEMEGAGPQSLVLFSF